MSTFERRLSDAVERLMFIQLGLRIWKYTKQSRVFYYSFSVYFTNQWSGPTQSVLENQFHKTALYKLGTYDAATLSSPYSPFNTARDITDTSPGTTWLRSVRDHVTTLCTRCLRRLRVGRAPPRNHVNNPCTHPEPHASCICCRHRVKKRGLGMI